MVDPRTLLEHSRELRATSRGLARDAQTARECARDVCAHANAVLRKLAHRRPRRGESRAVPDPAFAR